MTNWLSWLQSYLFKFDKHIVHAKFKWDSICICPSQFNTVLFFSRNKFPQDTSEGTILPKRHTNYDESSCNKLEISFKIIRIMLKGTAERRECRIDPSTSWENADWYVTSMCVKHELQLWDIKQIVLISWQTRPRAHRVQEEAPEQRHQRHNSSTAIRQWGKLYFQRQGQFTAVVNCPKLLLPLWF